MAKYARDKVLEDLYKKLENDAVIRKMVLELPTQVTYSRRGVIQAVKEGYAKIQKKLESEGRWYSLSDSEWNEIADAVLSYVETWATSKGTGGTLDREQTNADQVVYTADRDIQSIHKEAKKEARAKLDEIRQRNEKDKLKGPGRAAGLAFASGNVSEGFKLVNQSEVGQVNRSSHKLHKGATTVGAARLGAAMAFLDKDFGGFAASQKYTKLGQLLGEIDLVWNIKVNPKSGKLDIGLNENQFVELTVDAESENPPGAEPFDWSGEKGLKKVFEEAIFNYILSNNIHGGGWEDIEGSPSILQNAAQQSEYAVLKEITSVDNVSLKKGKLVKPKGRKSSNTSKRKPGSKKKAKPSTKTASPSPKQMRQTKAKRSNASLLQILAMINQKLPQTVAENMGDPRLNNRSGRFAASVRAVDVNVTPQGFPSIGYTYQKRPYQTFEQGYSQGDKDRDPRTLIDLSIREIMAEMAIGRFYTRRL